MISKINHEKIIADVSAIVNKKSNMSDGRDFLRDVNLDPFGNRWDNHPASAKVVEDSPYTTSSKIEAEEEPQPVELSLQPDTKQVHSASNEPWSTLVELSLEPKGEKSILQQADDIVNKRSEEGERKYGPVDEMHNRAAEIYNLMTGQDVTKEDIVKMMMAVKLARQFYAHKQDNLLDLVAYAQILDNFESENNNV